MKHTSLTSFTTIVVSLMLASTTLAATSEGLGKATAGIGDKNFCTNFTNLGKRYQTDIEDHVTKLQTQISTESQKIEANQQNADNTLTENRTKWLQDRHDIYSKLTAKATTDAEKQAVMAFQTTIEAAVTTREAAIDAAKETFRQATQQAVTQHQTDTKQVLSAYQTAVQAAFNQAKASCAAGTAAATVRTAFQAALTKARDDRQMAVQKVTKVNTQIQLALSARKAAVQAAIQAYQATLKQATATLKAAFAASTPTEPTNTNAAAQ